jgi:hypothetical protein
VSRTSRAALVLSAVALAFVAGVAPPWAGRFDAAAQSSPALVELRDLSELRARFNADSEFTRLVLLVSPT